MACACKTKNKKPCKNCKAASASVGAADDARRTDKVAAAIARAEGRKATESPLAPYVAYGLCKGFFTPSQLKSVGLDASALAASNPAGCALPPAMSGPYPGDPVVLGLARGMRDRLVSRLDITKVGLNPCHIENWLCREVDEQLPGLPPPVAAPPSGSGPLSPPIDVLPPSGGTSSGTPTMPRLPPSMSPPVDVLPPAGGSPRYPSTPTSPTGRPSFPESPPSGSRTPWYAPPISNLPPSPTFSLGRQPSGEMTAPYVPTPIKGMGPTELKGEPRTTREPAPYEEPTTVGRGPDETVGQGAPPPATKGASPTETTANQAPRETFAPTGPARNLFPKEEALSILDIRRRSTLR